MRLHKRELIVPRAVAEFGLAFCDIQKKHQLSYDQIVQVFCKLLLPHANAYLPDDLLSTETKAAANEAMSLWSETVTKNEITDAEATQALASEITSYMKWAIRAERHPDNPNKPGGLE